MFDLPEGLRFTCSRCGDCCRSLDVPLGAQDVERLRALDWSDAVPDLVGRETVVALRRPDRSATHRLARDASGACAFLSEEGSCLIHAHFGEEHKPLACRLYPFTFTRLGDRVAVDCALSCRSLAEGTGQPVAEHAPAWRRLLATAPPAPEARHAVRRGERLPADVMRELERHLLDVLADRSLDAFQRVRCALEFNRLATTGKATTPAARTLRQTMARALPDVVRRQDPDGELDPTQRAIFFQWLYLALNPVPADVEMLPAARRTADQRRRVRAGGRYADGSARPFVLDAEIRATFDEVAAVPCADQVVGDPDRQLERFLSAKIVGQRFLQEPGGEAPLTEAVPRLLLYYPMAAWTSKALAADAGRSRVEASDLTRAIRLLDRSVGQLVPSRLPKKQAKACDFVMLETDVVTAATLDMLAAG